MATSLPDRQLRNGGDKSIVGRCASLPDRQLRKTVRRCRAISMTSLPDRPLPEIGDKIGGYRLVAAL